MEFTTYLRRYWHMSENEFYTFSKETQRVIRHEYNVFNNK